MRNSAFSLAFRRFGICHQIALGLGTVACLCLAGCDREGDGRLKSERKADDARRADARERVADGVKCVQLLGAVASAKNGPLNRNIEALGLGAIEADFAPRWEARVKFDAREAGMTPEQVDRLLQNAPAVVLNAAELRNSANDAFSCASDVSGSHGS